MQISINDSAGGAIAKAWGLNEEAQANARLIASAPELFDALADCCKRLRVCSAVGGNSPDVIEALMEQFEAPLARARGES